MLFGLLLTLHLIICLALVLVVLLQSGKGGGLAGAFGGMGGGGGQNLFGGRGAATFLSKATTALGIAFMTSSLLLALLSSRSSGPESLIREQGFDAATPPPVSSQPLSIPAGNLSESPAPEVRATPVDPNAEPATGEPAQEAPASGTPEEGSSPEEGSGN